MFQFQSVPFPGYSALQLSSYLDIGDTKHQVFNWSVFGIPHLKIIMENIDYRRYITPEDSQVSDHV